MNTFSIIVGAVAAGKTTFMENKLYNIYKEECNFFDQYKAKLMIQLYASYKSKVNDINLSVALKNAILDSIKNSKDFMIQSHFTTEQLTQINKFFHDYKNKFDFNAHFIAVNSVEILKDRANKREQLGGHSSEAKSIDKSFNQSFRNFLTYLPKFKQVTIWDNSKDFWFHNMEAQLIFENGVLKYKNPKLTEYSNTLLKNVEVYYYKG